MNVKWDGTGEVTRLVAELTNQTRGFGRHKALGFYVDDRLVGGAIFNNYNPEAGVIEISLASNYRRWLSRDLLRFIGTYAFNDCGCQAMAARTTDDNATARMWRLAGAEEREIPHLRGRGKSEIVFVLTSDAWRASRLYR